MPVPSEPPPSPAEAVVEPTVTMPQSRISHLLAKEKGVAERRVRRQVAEAADLPYAAALAVLAELRDSGLLAAVSRHGRPP
jgi:hypothetical protein